LHIARVTTHNQGGYAHGHDYDGPCDALDPTTNEEEQLLRGWMQVPASDARNQFERHSSVISPCQGCVISFIMTGFISWGPISTDQFRADNLSTPGTIRGRHVQVDSQDEH